MAKTFATNDIKASISVDGGTTFIELVEATTINHEGDKNVEEYDKLGSKATVRVATGGIKNDYSFECKVALDYADGSFYKTLRDIHAGVNLGNDAQLKLEYPREDGDAAKTGEVKTYTSGVLSVSTLGGQGANDLAMATLSFQSSVLPTITEPEA